MRAALSAFAALAALAGLSLPASVSAQSRPRGERQHAVKARTIRVPDERRQQDANVYYPNCAAARAAGAAPIYRGQPGYRPEMDGDDDGIACEPYHGRR